jgi:arginyl-tRNA--protein-N-Asp/Glu arginylyltransferase
VSGQLFSHYPAIPPPLKRELPLYPEETCSYLSSRMSRYRAFHADSLSPELYHHLMDAGFRRSGDVFYQPACRGCRECVPLRVPVATFQPGKSQRRVWRQNTDLQLAVAQSTPTEEKLSLYERYMSEWHGSSSVSASGFVEFLYVSPVSTLEFCYRDGDGRLLAVGLCDVSPQSLSSVYFYFDPREARRSLGTLGALVEIEFARKREIPYYYLGYWVSGCDAMKYKANFGPHQILHPDGVWRAPVEVF